MAKTSCLCRFERIKRLLCIHPNAPVNNSAIRLIVVHFLPHFQSHGIFWKQFGTDDDMRWMCELAPAPYAARIAPTSPCRVHTYYERHTGTVC